MGGTCPWRRLYRKATRKNAVLRTPADAGTSARRNGCGAKNRLRGPDFSPVVTPVTARAGACSHNRGRDGQRAFHSPASLRIHGYVPLSLPAIDHGPGAADRGAEDHGPVEGRWALRCRGPLLG